MFRHRRLWLAALPIVTTGPLEHAPSAILRGSEPLQEPAVEALLHLHHEHRVAHVLGAADRFIATFADPLIEISRGDTVQRSRHESERRFAAYFAAARFLEWEDMTPPRISIVPDGDRATVAVEKRVRVLLTADNGDVRHEAMRFAWTGMWRRESEEWRLAAIETADPEERPDSVPLTDRIEAHEILRAARMAAGGEEAVASVATLSFVAQGEGPGGRFTTRVRSARDGRVAFRQSFTDRPAFEMGVSLEGSWSSRAPRSLTSAERRFIRGHELHLLAIAPEARFLDPRAAGHDTIAGRAVRVLHFLDPDGLRVEFFHDATTGLTAGFRLPDSSGPGAAPVTVIFDDWRAVGLVRLPFSITFSHRGDVFRYRITEASAQWLPDEAFRLETARTAPDTAVWARQRPWSGAYGRGRRHGSQQRRGVARDDPARSG